MMATSNGYRPTFQPPSSHYHSYQAPQQASALYAMPSQSHRHEQQPYSSHPNPLYNPSTERASSQWAVRDTSAAQLVGSASSSAVPGTQPTNMMANGGKKRKRLQRACVSCHKAKRRCDGGLPCSNCDFSGRTCAYSDSQGKAVPPTKRSLRPSEAAIQQQQQVASSYHHHTHSQDSYAPHHYEEGRATAAAVPRSPASHVANMSHGMSTPRFDTQYGAPSSALDTAPHSRAPMDASSSFHPHSLSTTNAESTVYRRTSLEPSPDVRRELLSIFFAQVQPWSCIVDEITLLRDLSSMSASPAIMFAIYAITLRHASRSRSETQRYYQLSHELGDGSTYASEARRILLEEDSKTGLSSLDGDLSLNTRQALLLLSCFEFESGHHERAASYIQHCCKYVNLTYPGTNDGEGRYSHPEWQDGQSGTIHLDDDKRTICLTIVLDVCTAVACRRLPCLRASDVQFVLDSIKTARSSSPSSSPLSHSSTSPVTGPRFRQTNQSSISDVLFHMLDVTLILSNALEIQRRALFGTQSSSVGLALADESGIGRQVQACEQYLQGWADQLPESLRFNESNLFVAERALRHHRAANGRMSTSPTSPALPGSPRSQPWSAAFALCWSAIHTFAESATIILQSALKDPLPLAAAQNLQIILERVQPTTYGGPITAFGILMFQSASRSPPEDAHSNAAAWTALARSSDRLRCDAQLDDKWVAEAGAWLSLHVGSSKEAKAGSRYRTLPPLRTADRHINAPSANMQPSWMATSPLTPALSSSALDEATGTAKQHFKQQSVSRSNNAGESVSPVQSTASLNGQMPILKSRHSSSASSTTSSSTIGGNSLTGGNQLPPLINFVGPSSTSKTVTDKVLPSLQLPLPQDDLLSHPHHKRTWSASSSVEDGSYGRRAFSSSIASPNGASAVKVTRV